MRCFLWFSLSICSLFSSARSNYPPAALGHWCSRVNLLLSESFSLKVTLATTKSLHWDERRLQTCLEGVRWDLKTSGILILTQAFPALQHSIVRGQDGLSMYGQESRHCPVFESWAAAVFGMSRNS